MARGGKREGAGRPSGAVTRRTREAAEAASESGLTPLEYMLSILRDETQDQERRMWAAEKAAPYVHAKLASVEHSGPDGGPIQSEATVSDDLRQALDAIAGKIAGGTGAGEMAGDSEADADNTAG